MAASDPAATSESAPPHRTAEQQPRWASWWDALGLQPGSDRQARAAAMAFGAYVVVATALLPTVLGAHRWFFHDEWRFVGDRLDDSLIATLEPHNEHWTTLPLWAFRAVYAVVGLHSYVPYQMLAVVTHLAVAVLLRVIMRRSGVRPWTATLVAATYVLFGSGEYNIIGGFQIAFTGALALGLAHLLLADHTGLVDRRDALGVVAGIAAVMCSAIGVVMIVPVALVALVRRGWRVALVHGLPPLAVFLAWYLAFAPTRRRTAPRSFLEEAGAIAEFVVEGVASSFVDLGQGPVVAIVIVAVLVVGLVLAWAPLERIERRRTAVVPVSLLLGAATFLALTAWGRALVESTMASTGRYVHIVVALVLPALAVAADAVMRRWRMAVPIVVVAIVAGIPGNIAAFGESHPLPEENEVARQVFLGMAHSPLGAYVDPAAVPYRSAAPMLTIGHLRDAVAAGEVPEPDRHERWVTSVVGIRLGLWQADRPLSGLRCAPVEPPFDFAPAEGSVFAVQADSVAMSDLDAPPDRRRDVVYRMRYGNSFLVVLPGLRLRLEPYDGGGMLTVCT